MNCRPHRTTTPQRPASNRELDRASSSSAALLETCGVDGVHDSLPQLSEGNNAVELSEGNDAVDVLEPGVVLLRSRPVEVASAASTEPHGCS